MNLPQNTPHRSIVDLLSPSPEQGPAIQERGRDVALTAGAGTGKTRTLVARYLSLLDEGLPLRSIVAITFTRKAAREMRNRVRETIRRYLEEPGLLETERSKWQTLYAGLDAARINTIHGLCTEILHAHPAEAGVDPDFSVLEEAQAGILQQAAMDEGMAWATDDQEAVVLFGLLGEAGLRTVLETMMAKRLDVLALFSNLPADPTRHWQQALQRRQQALVDAMTAREEWKAACGVLLDHVAVDSNDKMEVQRQAALEALKETTASLSHRLSSLAALDDVNLTGGKSSSWPGGREQLQEVKDALRLVRDTWRSFSGVLAAAWNEADEALASVMPQLRRVFEFTCRRYDVYKRDRQALDFDDLEKLALQLLQQHRPVLTYWSQAVRAVLVDEFQDTNARQRDLIAQLNLDGGKIFLVGDAKQSIYRFRGADVAVFRAERASIERNGGFVSSLDTSYRAHRDLIQALNDLLRPVLGEEPDSGRAWVEPFAPLEPFRKDAGAGFKSPFVEMHLTLGSKSEGALNRAAAALVRRITGMVESGQLQVVENDQPRPLNYGDVAILCRASSSFGAYEDALELAGIPFLTVAGRGFYGRPEIRDLLNALQALADPGHDLALAGLLRSPACGMSDVALYHLCDRQSMQGEGTSLWAVLQTGDTFLPSEEAQTAARAVDLIADLNGQVGRTQVVDLLKTLVDRTHYRAALIQAGNQRGARNVSKLLADAHASGITGVGEFLEYVNHVRGAGAREGEARATSEGAVQIMSVHAAKGLEFPVVVIGDIARSSPGSAGPLIDPDLGVLIDLKNQDDVLSSLYLLAKARADDQESAESDRLFYVAATRAREKLLISGNAGITRDGRLSRLNGWLGRICGPQGLDLAGLQVDHQEDGDRIFDLDCKIGQTPIACTIYEPQVDLAVTVPQPEEGTMPSIVLPPPLLAPIPAPLPAAPQDDGGEDDYPDGPRVWRVVPTARRPQAPQWVTGSLVHEALAAWRFPDSGFEDWCVARCRAYGLIDPAQVSSAADRTRNLLDRFRTSSLYQEMNAASLRLHEIPYTYRVGDSIDSGKIDALFQQDGTWTVVEFKTDRLRDRSELDTLLDRQTYLDQCRRYAQAIQQLLGQQPKVLLCLLDYARQVHVQPV